MTITLQAVNELIASLESAAELSIKERKYLELAKAYQQLAAENVGLKATSDDRRMFIMNGVQLGYIKVPTVETDPALETIRIAVSPQESTPATDRIVAGIKADALPANIAEIIDSGDLETICYESERSYAEDFRLALYNFRQLREGADK
ncbi:TPA: hypothetical protein ACHOZE_004416 [Raoultella ornithinolytica]